MRRFAQDTSVPVGRSRAAIDDLLRAWGCSQLQWSDDYQHGRVRLRFVWARDKVSYVARFDLQLPTEEQLREQAMIYRGTMGERVSDSKLDHLRAARGQQEHRILLLWLKAALNAVEQGIVSAAALFLPFLEDRDGNTVAEMAVPRLDHLLTGTADRLLPEGKEGRR